jgi:hypothetical protein
MLTKDEQRHEGASNWALLLTAGVMVSRFPVPLAVALCQGRRCPLKAVNSSAHLTA